VLDTYSRSKPRFISLQIEKRRFYYSKLCKAPQYNTTLGQTIGQKNSPRIISVLMPTTSWKARLPDQIMPALKVHSYLEAGIHGIVVMVIQWSWIIASIQEWAGMMGYKFKKHGVQSCLDSAANLPINMDMNRT